MLQSAYRELDAIRDTNAPGALLLKPNIIRDTVDVDPTMVEEALPEDRVLKENAIAELVNALS
jgi:hypothetical protein